jgi:hypothetical protein
MKKQQVVQAQHVKVNPNQSSGIIKLLRTVSFIVLFIVFALLQMHLLFDTQIEFILIDVLRPLLQPVQDIITSIDILTNVFFILSGIIVGFLLFTWTISKSVLIKVLLTIALVLSYIVMLVEETVFISVDLNVVLPDFLDGVVDLLSTLLVPLLSLHVFVPLLVIFVTFVLVTLLLAFRKPKRLSLTLVRIGVDIILLALFVEFAKVVLVDSFITANIFEFIQNYSFLIGYDFIAFGALFGILGFFRN